MKRKKKTVNACPETHVIDKYEPYLTLENT